MKINSNIPIFAILVIFIASNTLLYQYLNNDYFIDKKPLTEPTGIENVIFSLIAAHEQVLVDRNAAILLEAEQLRNRKATITDSAELKAIEDRLRALENESEAVLKRVKNSEHERIIAEKKVENNQLQLTELLESNSRMGAELNNINEEFNTYVTTIEDTLISNSFSNVEKDRVNLAFKNRRGLNYLNNLVGNIQNNKTIITQKFTDQLKSRSNSYHSGLKDIALLINDVKYEGFLDNKTLLIPDKSINKLKDSITQYKLSRDRELQNRENELLADTKNHLAVLSKNDTIKLQEALDKQNRSQEKIMEEAQEVALQEKQQSLEDLEKRLREELVEKGTVVEVDLPSPDIPVYTNWVHIPGMWNSSTTELSYTGKRVDSIAWSRNKIEDNQSISFTGRFKDNGECLLVLFGNGLFKSWSDGLIISISSLGNGRIIISISRNSIDENAENLYLNSVAVSGSINGRYYIQVSNGKLSIDLNGRFIIKDFPIETELSGKFGFANRESNTNEFSISNIKLFKIR